MSDAEIRPDGVKDRWDLWMFDDAPGIGLYASIAEAQAADQARTELAGGATLD